MSFDRTWLKGLSAFQSSVLEPVKDTATESPQAALDSLRVAVSGAPSSYRDYLDEALKCYVNHAYKGAIMLVWSATMSHLYDTARDHQGGIRLFEAENKAMFGNSNGYRRLRRRDDFMYLRDMTFIELGEKAGLYNRSTREMLKDRLKTRNRCGHPTGLRVGREEAVIFIESLCLNILSGKALNWQREA